MENKRVCVNRPIRVPNYEKVTVPGQPTYKRVCDNKEVERVRYEQETVTEKNPTTSNRCVRKTIPKTHEYTKKEFEVESKTDKGTVDIQVQECNIGKGSFIKYVVENINFVTVSLNRKNRIFEIGL